MTIRRVNAAVLFVHDLNKCMEFYRNVLGLEVVVSDDVSYAFKMHDQDFAIVHISAAIQMVGEEALGLGQAGHRVMLCADVDDVDDVYTALTAKGLTFIRPPISQAWGWRTAYFADPEGVIWELRQSISSRQAG